MQERADLIDGTFSLSSQKGEGTSITVTAPRWPDGGD
jgi:signal transduction histidine kinase